MRNLALQGSAAAVLALSCASTAQFTGDYAPATWTTTGVGFGGASAVFAADGSTLTLTGGDGGVGQTSTVTHTVLGSGTWSFDYVWNAYNLTFSSGFDLGYYTINGTKFDISLGGVLGEPGTSGSISVSVVAGDVIGWQVVSLDGIFGPGQLIIDEFQIPAPCALAMLGITGLAGPRRRRGFSNCACDA